MRSLVTSNRQLTSDGNRVYHLPILSNCVGGCTLCVSLGCLNPTDRTFQDAQRALDRAVSGEFKTVVFPANFFLFEHQSKLLEATSQRALDVVFQVSTESLNVEFLSKLRSLVEKGHSVNFVFNGRCLLPIELFSWVESFPGRVFYTFSVFRRDRVLAILKTFPSPVLEALTFHFSYHLRPFDGRLKCHQVYDLLTRVQKTYPDLKIRPPLGGEMWDPRVDPDLCMEPSLSPDPESHTENRSIEVSVVIPTYNNRPYVKNTLQHLLRQDLSRERFEVIIVDDGSDDGTREDLTEFIRSHRGTANLKYIFSPRAKPRKMGDANYRAGISRNLGVKHATGEFVCFLDSDILTPAGFLKDLITKHQIYDVIQCKRLNLVREKSSEHVRYEDVNEDSDVFHTDNGYWEKFHSFTDWQSEPYFWKYVCTYGLSLRLKEFKKVGWIKRIFIFYGFEDTELGYRLARAGHRFHLNDVVTYHLFHRTERSEFHNSDYLRHSLLAKTAQIFYLNLLEPEVYQHFRGMMNEQISFGTRLSTVLGPAHRVIGYLTTPLLYLRPAFNVIKNSIPEIETVRAPLRKMTWTLFSLFHFLKRHFWRIKIPFIILSGLRWVLYPFYRRCRDSLWVLKMPIYRLQKLYSKSWVVRVATQRLIGESWRLRVLAEKIFISSFAELLWRTRVLAQRIHSHKWRLLLLPAQCRLIIGITIAQSWNLVWKLSWPARKIYYFSRFQLETRIAKRLTKRRRPEAS